MRILCYTNKLNHGGAERVMSIIANKLFEFGHEVFLINDYKFDDEYPINSDIPHYYIDGNYKEKKGNILSRTLRRVLFLRKICRLKKIDVIISFISDANYRAVLATLGIRTKNIISVRNDPYIDYHRKRAKILAKIFYSKADGCVFQTDRAKRFFSKNIQDHSCVIANPISDAFLCVRNVPLQEKKIVACGRLTKQKRFDVLIDAFSILKKKYLDYYLEIYGDGEYRDVLNKQINELHLESSVFLKGRSTNIQDDIGNASMFVLSSDYEGLPNALLEALALGLPCVSTDCDGAGPRSIIDNGIDGLLVEKGNPLKLAEVMASVLENERLATRLSENARDKGRQFSSSNVVKQWELYIKKLLNSI